jgi:predicted SAM-dependent methyltransferase
MIKHYAPNEKVLKHIEIITQGKKVLELGPGNIPFKNATEFVGWEHGVQPIDKKENHKVCDFNHHPLPYKDKEFDFVYCSHVLEDLIYPFRVMEEMK